MIWTVTAKSWKHCRERRERGEFSAQHKPFLYIFMLPAHSQEAEPVFSCRGSCGRFCSPTPLPPWAPGQPAPGDKVHTYQAKPLALKVGKERGAGWSPRGTQVQTMESFETLWLFPSHHHWKMELVLEIEVGIHSYLLLPPIHHVHLLPQILKGPGTLPHGMGETTCPS